MQDGGKETGKNRGVRGMERGGKGTEGRGKEGLTTVHDNLAGVLCWTL